LADRSGIGNIGHGNEGCRFGAGIPPQDDVEGDIWLEVGSQKQKVVREGGCSRTEDRDGGEGLLRNGTEKSSLVLGGYEGVERGLKFLRGFGETLGIEDFCGRKENNHT
jgi:hypothetical protein